MTDTELRSAVELLEEMMDGTARGVLLHLLTSQDVVTVLGGEDSYLTADEICRKSGNTLRPSYLQRMLRYAASLGAVGERSRDGVPEFCRTLVTDLLRRGGAEGGLGARAELLCKLGIPAVVRARIRNADIVVEENPETPSFEVGRLKDIRKNLTSHPILIWIV